MLEKSSLISNHRKEQKQRQIKEIIDIDLGGKKSTPAELLFLSNPKTLNNIK